MAFGPGRRGSLQTPAGMRLLAQFSLRLTIVAHATPAKQVFAMTGQHHIEGVRRKGMTPHWSSRAARRLAGMKGMD